MAIRKAVLFLFLYAGANAVEFQTIHSSVQLYVEDKRFENSKQKNDGNIYGVAADVHAGASEYRFAYEHGDTDTKKPPLSEDLKVDKLFLKYAYTFTEAFTANVNYINILHDNIAITDGGVVYGAGLTYTFNKKLSGNFTQFYTDYDDFNVYQSDLRIDYKMKIDMVRVKLSSVTKYINIDEEHRNTFTKNAQSDYLTSAVELHAHYKTWHFGTVGYFGKRAFAVMNDGFKIQHHAMEFDRTYAVGMGKTIGDFVVRLQYIYQRATELPMLNEGVKVKNTRVLVNYKF